MGIGGRRGFRPLDGHHHFLCLLAQSLLLFEWGLSSLRILLTVMNPATIIKIMIRFTVTRLFIDHFHKDSMMPVVCYSIYRNNLALSKRFFGRINPPKADKHDVQD
jgi:hypothetical protein